MISFGVFLLYMGWSLVDPLEVWSMAWWGRITIVSSVAVLLYSVTESIDKSHK